MERKETYIAGGIVALLLIGGFAWWTYSDDTASPASTETPTGESTDNTDVKTADTPAKRAAAAYTVTRAKEGTAYVATVTLTATGFSPRIVEIERGDSVRFINKSGKSMRVTSDTFEGAPIYAGFNQVKSVGMNGTYSLSFSEAGVWGYHNLGTETDIGIVYVK
ncbi:hypothetical protein K8Q93_01980 [Candidatus Parcubacteria bacterium]|nr:hypothetical protein [Candidatus Parcubacteria bacterium]